MKPISNDAAERAAEREAMNAWCREEREYREREAWDGMDRETWEAREERDRIRYEIERWYWNYGGVK